MSYNKEEDLYKETIIEILSDELKQIDEFYKIAEEFKKVFLKSIKINMYTLDSAEEEYSEVREMINSNILTAIYSLSLSEINNLFDILNYNGYLYNEDAYLNSIKNDEYFSVNDKKTLLSSFKDYISIHNKNVLEERKKRDYTDLNQIKEYLLSIISDNKIYVQSMLAFENGKNDKLKILSHLTEDKFVINNHTKNIIDTNFDDSRNLKNYSSVQSIERLYRFIRETSDIEFADKHFKIFMQLPFINEYDKNLFISYASFIEVSNEKARRLKKEKARALRSKEKEKENSIILPEIIEEKNTINEIDDYLEECLDVSEMEIETVEKTYLPKSIQIYNCIKSCDNSFDDVLKTLLPKIDHQQFYNILYEVFEMLQEDFDIFIECDYISENFLEDESGPNELSDNKKIEDLDGEFLHLYFAKQYLTDYINKEEEPILTKPLEVNETNGLFFAKKSLNDESYLKTDIKNLPKECYSEACQLLKKAYHGYKTFNPKKQKKFSNHKLLKNIYEFKSKNLRLFYQHLGGNNYFFLGIFEKKNKNLNNIVINRSKNGHNQFSNIKQMIIDKNVPDDLILSNSIEFEQCVELVKESEKGENENGKIL